MNNYYKAEVYVRLKDNLLDPQGKAIKEAAKLLGNDYNKIKDIRVGKFIEIKFSSSSKDEAKKIINNLSNKLLTNSVIEEYKYKIYNYNNV